MTSQLNRAQTTELRRVGAADPQTAVGLRRDLESWLTDEVPAPLDAAVRADIVLTAAEALANSAEHAYADTAQHPVITFHARYEAASGCVTVCIGDHGQWKQPSPRSATSSRGRGLTLMQRLSTRCHIDRRADGTTVCMDHHLT